MNALTELGWGPQWQALLDSLDGPTEAGRVVRHDGAGLLVATGQGVRRAMFASRLRPEPAVGDWVALAGDAPVAVLPRSSLLRRRTALGDDVQALAANVDRVLVVCGLDRPVRAGRLQRAATLARDAGAEPVVVLTKAALVDAGAVRAAVDVVGDAVGDLDVVVTSVKEGLGLDELLTVVHDRTVVLLGESGAGKSSIVNALLGADVAATGAVRVRDAKGRHTTTSRQLHVLPGGGVLVDTPGIRAVGLWVEPEAVDATFADLDELAEECRFADCRHEGEPGCVVAAAVTDGTVDAGRVDAWRRLRAEAATAAARSDRRDRRRRAR